MDIFNSYVKLPEGNFRQLGTAARTASHVVPLSQKRSGHMMSIQSWIIWHAVWPAPNPHGETGATSDFGSGKKTIGLERKTVNTMGL